MSLSQSSNQNGSYPHEALAAGTLVGGYRIQSVLGRGTFGITYLATEEKLERLVAIKEYLPQEFAVRDESSTVQPRTPTDSEMFQYGRDSFLREARTLVKFRHPNIVRVLTFFEQYDTAYLVMEYEEGVDLSEYLQKNAHLSQSDLLDIFMPINQGLAIVHEVGFVHRDIKPANIYIRNDDSPVLLDFGATRDLVKSNTAELTRILTQGYAPYEQDNPAWFEQGPWTDIYALGATLYMAVMGHKPVSASERAAAFMMKQTDPYVSLCTAKPQGYAYDFLKAIDQALEFHPEARPQSLDQWNQMLMPQSSDATVVMVDRNVTSTSFLQSPKRSFFPVVMVAVVVLGIAAVLFYIFTAEREAANHLGGTNMVNVPNSVSIENGKSPDTPSIELLDSLIGQVMVHAKLAVSQYATAQVTKGHIEQYQNLPSSSDRTRFIADLQIKLNQTMQDYEKNVRNYSHTMNKLVSFPAAMVEDGIQKFMQQADYRDNQVYQQLGDLVKEHAMNESTQPEQWKLDLINLSVQSSSLSNFDS